VLAILKDAWLSCIAPTGLGRFLCVTHPSGFALLASGWARLFRASGAGSFFWFIVFASADILAGLSGTMAATLSFCTGTIN
jgi:hypothetical protein